MSLPSYAMNVSSFPEMYERLIVPPIFRPWVDALLDGAALAAGDRLLDIACGTGIVARVARERLGPGATVVGVDLSPQMLDVARSVTPDVDWREGSAGALPVEAGEKFDVVTCQQGVQFFPDKTAAAMEMRRVLVPGGRVAVATWASLDEMPCFLELGRVAEKHVGPVVDQRYGFGDARALEKLLVDAGFRDVRLERQSRTIRLPDPPLFVRMNAMAIVGMSSLPPDEHARAVDAIVSDSEDLQRRYTDGGQLAFDMTTNVAFARA